MAYNVICVNEEMTQWSAKVDVSGVVAEFTFQHHPTEEEIFAAAEAFDEAMAIPQTPVLGGE